MEKSLNLQAKEELLQKINTSDEKSFLRTIFCRFGNLSAEKNGGYRLEIIAEESLITRANNLIAFFLQPFKQTKWQKNSVLYSTSSEEICDFLAFIGANNAVLELQNLIIAREQNNINNRKINMFLANTEKANAVSLKQIEMLSKIEKEIGVDNLPQKLKEAANARLDNPQKSMDELAEMIGISKSGFVHRMNKIKSLLDVK